MPPRRRPRSWLAGRLRSVAGAVQRLAERVDDPAAAPERPVDPPRRLGEPPQHWVDLVAAHAPGLLRELDLDLAAAAPTHGPAHSDTASPRQRDSSGPVGETSRPATGRTDERAATTHDRLGDPPGTGDPRPGNSGGPALHDPELVISSRLRDGGSGAPEGGADRRPLVIRPAAPGDSEAAARPASSESAARHSGPESAGGGRPTAPPGTPGTAHLRKTSSTPAPQPPDEILEGFGPSRGALPPRSSVDPAATRHGRGDERVGGLPWPALPGEPGRRRRLGEHHADGHAPHHTGHVAEQQQASRYRRPEGAGPRHDRHAAPRHDRQPWPDRDQHLDTPYVDTSYVDTRRGGEVGQRDGWAGSGTGPDEVGSHGRWPASAALPSTAVGPDVDPWPALPDDGPLWTVPGAALDAGHERRLDREQAGG